MKNMKSERHWCVCLDSPADLLRGMSRRSSCLWHSSSAPAALSVGGMFSLPWTSYAKLKPPRCCEIFATPLFWLSHFLSFLYDTINKICFVEWLNRPNSIYHYHYINYLSILPCDNFKKRSFGVSFFFIWQWQSVTHSLQHILILVDSQPDQIMIYSIHNRKNGKGSDQNTCYGAYDTVGKFCMILK